MRKAQILTVGLAWMLSGATCVPLIGPGTPSPDGLDLSDTVAISVLTPSVSREVPVGTIVPIEWALVNQTGSEGVVTLLARSRLDLSETIIVGGLRLPVTGTSRVDEWNTSGFFRGEYSVIGRIEVGATTQESSAPGRITLNAAPQFEFLEPAADVTLEAAEDPNDPNADPEQPRVRIRWSAFDADGDGNVQIGIDPGLNHASGNEIIISQQPLPAESAAASVSWDGTNSLGQQVDPGTYYLYAEVTDGINEDQVIDGLARITVPPWPDTVTTAITAPTERADLLREEDTLRIEFTLDHDEDTLLDFEVDTDDNHRNGNETAIVDELLIDADTAEDFIIWTGDDTDGIAVPDGIYRILMLVNRDGASPTIMESEDFVYLRNDEEQPLVAALKPDTDITVSAGSDVQVTWRDDVPEGVDARIRVTLDDDSTPDEAVETGEDEIVFLTDRDAVGDQDTLNIRYAELNDLEPGDYTVFVYVDRDGVAPFDHVSIANGLIKVEDDGG